MKVICPICRKPGTLKIRSIGFNRYVIIDHKNTQHSLGNVNNRDKIINELVNAYREYLETIIK